MVSLMFGLLDAYGSLGDVIKRWRNTPAIILANIAYNISIILVKGMTKAAQKTSNNQAHLVKLDMSKTPLN